MRLGALMQTMRADAEGVAGPKPQEIRDELERILSSAEFHAPGRGRRFLEFVVEETLAGRSESLKAYTIAQDVFAREASFDAQNDPVVRIEAGRIRRALERYYLVAGNSDHIVITIPKGGYVPFFSYAAGTAEAAYEGEPSASLSERTEAAERSPLRRRKDRNFFRVWTWLALPAALVVVASVAMLYPTASFFAATHQAPSMIGGADQPKIIVEPFLDITDKNGTSEIAKGLTDEVVGQLAKFKEIVVIAKSASEAETGTEARFFTLQGSVRVEDDKLRLIVRLVRSADDAVIWANNYDADLRAQNTLDVQSNVGQRIATAVADPYGFVFQSDAAEVAKLAGSDWEGYACMRSYYSYRVDLNPENHAAVSDCLKQATQRLPTNSTYWALLALTYLDEVRFQYQVGSPPSRHPLELAEDAAQRAADLDPRMRGRCRPSCWSVSSRAISLLPSGQVPRPMRSTPTIRKWRANTASAWPCRADGIAAAS